MADDFDAQIAEHERAASQLRLALPQLAAEVRSAAAHFASQWWAEEIRRRVDANAARITADPEPLKALKADLVNLQGNALKLATEDFEEVLHDRDDEALRAGAVVENQWRSGVRIEFPEFINDKPYTEGLRRLMGRLQSALQRADLYGSKATESISEGRYLYALPNEADTNGSFKRAVDDHRRTLVELVGAVVGADLVRDAQQRAQARSLWDDA